MAIKVKWIRVSFLVAFRRGSRRLFRRFPRRSTLPEAEPYTRGIGLSSILISTGNFPFTMQASCKEAAHCQTARTFKQRRKSKHWVTKWHQEWAQTWAPKMGSRSIGVGAVFRPQKRGPFLGPPKWTAGIETVRKVTTQACCLALLPSRTRPHFRGRKTTPNFCGNGPRNRVAFWKKRVRNFRRTFVRFSAIVKGSPKRIFPNRIPPCFFRHLQIQLRAAFAELAPTARK